MCIKGEDGFVNIDYINPFVGVLSDGDGSSVAGASDGFTPGSGGAALLRRRKKQVEE